MATTRVKAHKRTTAHGTTTTVAAYDRETFRGRLAEASGGASERLPVQLAAAGVAAGAAGATIVTAIAYGLQVAAAVGVVAGGVTYVGLAKWARKRGVTLPPLYTPGSRRGRPVDARKVRARARRRRQYAKARSGAYRWGRHTAWPWARSRPVVIRAGWERDRARTERAAASAARTAGRVYRRIKRNLTAPDYQPPNL